MRRAFLLLLSAMLAACAHQPERRSTLEVRDTRDTREPSRSGPREEGLASWYGREHQGGPTASGERFDMHAMTAAHRTLRMQTRVRVTSKLDGKSVVVRINDRGPYARGRVIDLSYAAARALDMLDRGVIPVFIEVLP